MPSDDPLCRRITPYAVPSLFRECAPKFCISAKVTECARAARPRSCLSLSDLPPPLILHLSSLTYPHMPDMQVLFLLGTRLPEETLSTAYPSLVSPFSLSSVYG